MTFATWAAKKVMREQGGQHYCDTVDCLNLATWTLYSTNVSQGGNLMSWRTFSCELDIDRKVEVYAVGADWNDIEMERIV